MQTEKKLIHYFTFVSLIMLGNCAQDAANEDRGGVGGNQSSEHQNSDTSFGIIGDSTQTILPTYNPNAYPDFVGYAGTTDNSNPDATKRCKIFIGYKNKGFGTKSIDANARMRVIYTVEFNTGNTKPNVTLLKDYLSDYIYTTAPGSSGDFTITPAASGAANADGFWTIQTMDFARVFETNFGASATFLPSSVAIVKFQIIPENFSETDVTNDVSQVVVTNPAGCSNVSHADPSNLTVTATGKTSVGLHWNVDVGGLASVYIKYMANGVPEDCGRGIVPGTVYSTNLKNINVTGLQPSTSYGFRVCAVGIGGVPSPGITIQATTASGGTISTPPPQPQAVTPPNVKNLDAKERAGKIILNWDSGGGSTKTFRIAYQAGTVAPANCAANNHSVGADTDFTLDDIARKATYSFRVCAEANGMFSTGTIITATSK